MRQKRMPDWVHPNYHAVVDALGKEGIVLVTEGSQATGRWCWVPSCGRFNPARVHRAAQRVDQVTERPAGVMINGGAHVWFSFVEGRPTTFYVGDPPPRKHRLAKIGAGAIAAFWLLRKLRP